MIPGNRDKSVVAEIADRRSINGTADDRHKRHIDKTRAASSARMASASSTVEPTAPSTTI